MGFMKGVSTFQCNLSLILYNMLKTKSLKPKYLNIIYITQKVTYLIGKIINFCIQSTSVSFTYLHQASVLKNYGEGVEKYFSSFSKTNKN